MKTFIVEIYDDYRDHTTECVIKAKTIRVEPDGRTICTDTAMITFGNNISEICLADGTLLYLY